MNRWIDFFTVPRNMAVAIFAACFGALGFAYVMQYGFNYQPCILCLYQRIPYAVAGVIAILSLKYPRLLPLTVLVFLCGAALAGFHTGVEQKWWPGLNACGDANLPAGGSLSELQDYLTHRPIVRCDVPTWKLFGLSMTAYNFMLSVALTAFTAYFTLMRRKKIA